MTRIASITLALSLVALATLGADCGPDPPPPDKRAAKLSALSTDVFEPRCSASVCHGGPTPAANFDLITDPYTALVGPRAACDGATPCEAGFTCDTDLGECLVTSDYEPTHVRVTPGDPDNSLLYLALQDAVGTVERMPQGGAQLDADDIDQIKRWIADGAKDN